ncbi:prepilin peptidase [Limosilactobacillus sp.]|uniref:prepilin peptidase n=1 Tax=Limosilactobacillus sp. TaxID=2773925 RepID=UPI003EFF4FCE
MLSCYYFIIGTILGSFACLTGYRLGTGKLPWSPPRSHCDSCHQQLRFWQLIPIVGWLLQAGHCRYCHAPISLFFPLTEVCTGLAVASLCNSRLLYSFTFIAVITSLVILASSDYFHHFIFPIFITGLSPLFFLYQPSWSPLDLFFAGIEITLFSFLTFVNKSLGSGDWEFLLMTLLTLGWFNTALITFFASVFSGLAFFRLRTIPLMPGLGLGTILTLVWLKQTGALP